MQDPLISEWRALYEAVDPDGDADPPTELNAMKAAIKAIKVLRSERTKMVRQLILFLYECTSIL
jgi:hypothetical protein